MKGDFNAFFHFFSSFAITKKYIFFHLHHLHLEACLMSEQAREMVVGGCEK
jgi:hypothetical protein